MPPPIPSSSSSKRTRFDLGDTINVVGGKHSRGLGKGKTVGAPRRHRSVSTISTITTIALTMSRRILRDNIQGITKPDIRRMARRGGVKRISSGVYEETRMQLRTFLEKVMTDVCAVVDRRRVHWT